MYTVTVKDLFSRTFISRSGLETLKLLKSFLKRLCSLLVNLSHRRWFMID